MGDLTWNFLKKLAGAATTNGRDRRKHKRIPMTGEIEYRESALGSKSKQSPANEDIDDKPWSTGWIQDFSYGGVRISIPQPMTAGTSVDLKITLPIHNNAIELDGFVAWTKPHDSIKDYTDIGIAFSKRSAYQVLVVDRACNEMVAFALRSASELATRQALTINDFQNSLALAYREYNPELVGNRDSWAQFCNTWIFNKQASTFLLESHDQLFGSVTFVPDSDNGLPSERYLSEEIKSLRSPNRRLAEVALLTLDNESLLERFAKTDLARLAAFIRLLKIALEYACKNGVTNLLICSSPNYQNILSYLSFTPLVRAGALASTSMITMHLDVSRARDNIKNIQTIVLEYLYRPTELPALTPPQPASRI